MANLQKEPTQPAVSAPREEPEVDNIDMSDGAPTATGVKTKKELDEVVDMCT